MGHDFADTAPQQKADPKIKPLFMPYRPKPDQNATGGREKIYWLRFKTPAEMFYATT